MLHFIAAQTVQHDDNLYRLSPESDAQALIGTETRSDLFSSSSLTAELDKKIGRQRITGSYRHALVRYRTHKRANYDASDGALGWRGGFGANNVWEANYKRTAVQADYADFQSAGSNLVTTDKLGAGAELRYRTDWLSALSLSRDTVRNSAEQRRGGDHNTRNALVEWGYRPLAGNILTVQYRFADRDYLRGTDWRQNEVALRTRYLTTPGSRLDARVGVLQQRTDGGESRRHAMASLEHNWAVTGASTLSLKLFRDKVAPLVSNPVMAETWGMTARWVWAPRAKLRLESELDYRKRHYDTYRESPAQAPIDRRETLRAASLMLNYLATEAVSIQAGVRNDKRDANHQRFNFDAQAYWLSLQGVF